MMKELHIRVTADIAEADKCVVRYLNLEILNSLTHLRRRRAILDGLKKVGFKYKLGAGLLYNAMTRGGGYYLGELPHE